MRKIAFSNIAWDTSEDTQVCALLNKFEVNAIDIAPGKYFPKYAQTSAKQIREVKEWWRFRGVEITGMQSLLFGTQGLNLFSDKSIQEAMLSHLEAVCRIAGELGAPRLVFGSPKNRDRSGLNNQEALEVSRHFFFRLGEIATRNGVMICIEPNPKKYDCNFLTSTYETAQFVEELNHPSVRMQLDTGALTLNEEDYEEIIRKYHHLFGHIHLSEPNLAILGSAGTDHHGIAEVLNQVLPSQLVSIEMVASKDFPHLVAMEQALKLTVELYRN